MMNEMKIVVDSVGVVVGVVVYVFRTFVLCCCCVCFLGGFEKWVCQPLLQKNKKGLANLIVPLYKPTLWYNRYVS